MNDSLDIIKKYHLIDISKQPVQPTIKTAMLTKWESNQKNVAFRANGRYLKYTLKDT